MGSGEAALVIIGVSRITFLLSYLGTCPLSDYNGGGFFLTLPDTVVLSAYRPHRAARGTFLW